MLLSASRVTSEVPRDGPERSTDNGVEATHSPGHEPILQRLGCSDSISGAAVIVSTIQENTATYEVVVNREEQYSIWPSDREIPLGWRTAGRRGSEADCLAYIKSVWTDMRPS